MSLTNVHGTVAGVSDPATNSPTSDGSSGGAVDIAGESAANGTANGAVDGAVDGTADDPVASSVDTTNDAAAREAVKGAGREDLRAVPSPGSVRGEDDAPLPVKMLSDRVLVRIQSDGERRSSGGILIPATAQPTRRLAWAEVVATGPNVRAMEPGDRVLFNPEDRYEVEVRGEDYIILRERDVHAVAAPRIEDPTPGLYL